MLLYINNEPNSIKRTRISDATFVRFPILKYACCIFKSFILKHCFKPAYLYILMFVEVLKMRSQTPSLSAPP